MAINTTLSDQTKKAFDYATDTTKQVITLSTAILTLTATFSEKIFTAPKFISQLFSGSAWLSLLISIICGVWTLLQLTTVMAQPVRAIEPSIDTPKIYIPALVQQITFMIGLAALIGYGFYSISHPT